MSLTLTELLALVRERLPDQAVWTDANLSQWVIDAVADYSTVFPREELEASIDCKDGVREYALAEELVNPHNIMRVEYPDGEDPPEYLARRAIQDPRGFYGGAYYDVLGSPPATLVIGEEPSAAEDIVVTYAGDHAYPLEGDDVLTVPDSHLEALVLFVLWKAAEHLRSGEAADPQTLTLLLTQYDTLVYRADQAYRAWVRLAEKQRAESGVVSWGDLGLE